MHSKETVFLPKEERTDKPSSLFFLYCAANIGILGLVYGAIIVGFHLSFFQAILATVLGSFSFALVGLMSLSGHDTGTNTFILSRAAFGFKGNLIPAIALAIFVTLVLVSVLFSHKVLIRMQTISTYLFGFLTLVILVIIVPQTDWSMLMTMPSGDWLGNFLPALAFVAAGTGIGWTSYAADYSCHQDPQNSRSKVAWAVTLGGAVPLILMLSVGILLSTQSADLAQSANPIEVIKDALPMNLAIIYYITAIGGLTPQCFLGLKSSKLVLQAAHLIWNEALIFVLQAIIVTIIPALILFVAQDFQAALEGFLGVIGKLLAAWSSIFLVDYLMLRGKQGYSQILLTDPSANEINYNGVISWIIGFAVGMLFSKTFFFTGPFATGIFAGNSLNVLLTLVVAGGLYFLLTLCHRQKRLE